MKSWWMVDWCPVLTRSIQIGTFAVRLADASPPVAITIELL
jgi:hypothetical protein